MSINTAQKRLMKDYARFTADPPEYIQVFPKEKDCHTWYFVLTGPAGTPYEGGEYLGKLHFLPDYPFSPPTFRMLTPSGRFNPGDSICLSTSAFHREMWQPTMSLTSLCIGFLSFFTEESDGIGSIHSGDQVRRQLAAKSKWWNKQHPEYPACLRD